MNAPLLIELFTEELPPKVLEALGDAFASRIFAELKSAGLLGKTATARSFATPRRLAALISDVQEKAADRQETRKLMPAKIAYGADGKATAALTKKLEKEGGLLSGLTRQIEGGEEYVFLHRSIPGVALASGLQSAIESAIASLPIPKMMSYQLADGTTTVQFVRPAHGMVALHGEKVVDVSVLGLKANRNSHGHRFQGARNIAFARAEEYEAKLEAEGGVIADFERRKALISRQLAEAAASLGGSLGPQENVTPLLDEVTALVEFPTVYVGQFGSEFLTVPQECLILTMRQNQKYFPLFDVSSRLTNKFLIVSNMRLADSANVVTGNQRVVRPRLADARFFFETDKKTRLADRVKGLASVVYHNKLGTQFDRGERVRALAGLIAPMTGADPAAVDRAALLAKADLLTQMVGEFPELQGTMGRYYALADGEDIQVAEAIEQHYRPRFAGDQMPANDTAIALALADKMETLAGLFGIGQLPTGDKDPFALRRHALGTLRMLIECRLPATLSVLVSGAFSIFPPGMLGHGNAHAELETFLFERLRSYLRDAGYSANEIEAVLCLRPMRIDKVPQQLAAVRAFAQLPEAESLASANKRVANILKQAETRGEASVPAEVSLLKEKAERDLFTALKAASAHATPLFQQGDFAGYLKTFAALKSPVDAFFDSVMVMVEDSALRSNRLALLRDLRSEMNRIADISKLAA
jgi:glycyl-tRNA synthetase beta chain